MCQCVWVSVGEDCHPEDFVSDLKVHINDLNVVTYDTIVASVKLSIVVEAITDLKTFLDLAILFTVLVLKEVAHRPCVALFRVLRLNRALRALQVDFVDFGSKNHFISVSFKLHLIPGLVNLALFARCLSIKLLPLVARALITRARSNFLPI